MSNNIIPFIKRYLSIYSSAGPRDVYKALYQCFMGNEHMLGDCFHAKKCLFEEFESAAPIAGVVFERLLDDSEIVRVNLRAFKAANGDIDQLWNAVNLTTKVFKQQPAEFAEAWNSASKALVEFFPNSPEIKLLDDLANQPIPQAAHHSERFRREENPSYRIVSVKAIEGIGGNIYELFVNQYGVIPKQTEVMSDVAGQRPKHEIAIDRVGIENLQYPIVVLDRDNKRQSTVAQVQMSVELPSIWRGTHLSRFIEIINKYRGEITQGQIEEILIEILKQFKAQSAHLTLEFPYFIEKTAPVSRLKSLMEYKAVFDGEIESGGYSFKLGVIIPVTTLCPCSKELCEKSAHSQRAYIKIEVKSRSFIWIEELVEIGERSASAPLFATLKREDEKFVTEMAYENPRFVEDVVRAVAQELRKNTDIEWFRVRTSSDESIHNHRAFALIEGGQC